jgi:hypothetical protein
VIKVSSLPSARAESGGLFQLVDLEACPSKLLTRPIGANGHPRAGSVDRRRDPEEELQRLSRERVLPLPWCLFGLLTLLPMLLVRSAPWGSDAAGVG